MPDWSNTLLHLYWQKRALRAFDNAGRVRVYRAIQKEKCRLLDEVGIDREEVRLLCRWLANMQNKSAETRYKFYAAQLKLAI